ncbi:right-handed parallel beta-helix repeat-containing protein [Mucilaginibacter sp. HMF5004]|uniref:glycoside hydrolase family 28 protein n=1 Tax=Mucilaginibacter rivuli TaxID=2857527 RepID=UPI001C5CD46E|nr:glycosyl hydrolase family 28 protein [Mucilaginibacter rivuli]MBW4889243.1 right-handed parallel beta-helix repeat-containing protein [Mucilaginibacter rivuli]
MNKRRVFLKQAGLGLLAIPATSLAFGATTVQGTTAPVTPQPPPTRIKLNIRSFGAVGDGKTKDTVAIQQTIDRCNVLGGGEVFIPEGNYFTGAIQLRSNVALRLGQGSVLLGTPDFADYPVTQVRWEGKWIQGHTALIYGNDAHNISITGPGKIVGNDALGGRPSADKPLRHPALIEPINCSNITFEDFSTSYHLMWSIHLTCCDNISIKNLNIRSTGGNGDGIDVDSCKHVLIDGCDIATGDDCISLKSGRGMEGYAMLRTTEDVRITNCTFADSIFACIGIGSETSGGIRNVLIENCKFTYAKSFALYIKSRVGRGAFIEDITVNNIDVSGTEGGLLRFNLSGSGLQDQIPVPGIEGVPTTKNFKFTNIKVTDVPVLVDGTGVHSSKPLDGFVFSNITGTCKKGISLANIKNAKLSKINVTGYSGPLLGISNVTGSGLDGAADIPAPKFIELIPANDPPYQLH